MSIFFLRLKACDIVGIYDTPENTAQICKVMVFVGMFFLIRCISLTLADFAVLVLRQNLVVLFKKHGFKKAQNTKYSGVSQDHEVTEYLAVSEPLVFF